MLTTKIAIENYTLKVIDDSFDDQIEEWIEAVSNHIQNYTGVQFIADAEFVERKFDGNGRAELLVDNFIELETVTVNDSEVEVVSYPANKLPKYKLYSQSGFGCGRQNVVVSARFGFSEEIPADIKFVATVFVAGIINSNAKLEGDIVKEKIGNYDVTYKTDPEKNDFKRAMEIMNRYKEYYL